MNKIKQMSIILMSTFALVACGETGQTSEDLEENWSTHIQEGNEALNDYASDTNIDLKVQVGPDMMTDEDNAFIHVRMVGDLEKGYIEDGSGEFYFDGTDVYVLENGNWNHYPDNGPIDYPSWYPNVVEALVEIEEFIEANHTEGTITLSYDGNDREIWNAFEEEFALSIDGISEENINIKLDATLDDTEFFLQDLTLDILGEETDGEVELGSVAMLIDVDYFDHNEIDLSQTESEIFENVSNE